LLTHMMMSEHMGVNLKSSICRLIIKETNVEHGTELCPGLISMMEHGSLFLATYACAALINLSQAMDLVKNWIMRAGIANICMRLLHSKDDDLMLYTLMLLVHLTKQANHRAMMKKAGLVSWLNKTLAESYDATAVKYRRRIIVEICSVLGQMCNDDDTRRETCEGYQAIECLIKIFEHEMKAPPPTYHKVKKGDPADIATQLASKAMFCLKQLCVGMTANESKKEQVCQKVIEAIVEQLQLKSNLAYNRDWSVNALLLLAVLAINRNCSILIKKKGWTQVYEVLTSDELGTMDATRDRIVRINERIKKVAENSHAFLDGH